MPVRIVNGRPMMDPARLCHRITFLESTAGTDDSGSTVTWAAGDPPDTAWAEIAPMRGVELIKSGQDVSQVWLTITMRYNRSKVREADARLLAPSGSVYVIKYIRNILEMNVWLELDCLGLGTNL